MAKWVYLFTEGDAGMRNLRQIGTFAITCPPNNIKNINQKCASCSCQAYYAHIFIVTHINVLSTDFCAVYTISFTLSR